MLIFLHTIIIVFVLLISSYLNKKGTSGQEEVQKELKFVLTMLREKKANSSLSSDMREIWVNQYSTSREIQTWLTAKGFSEKCIDFIFYLDIYYSMNSIIQQFILLAEFANNWKI